MINMKMLNTYLKKYNLHLFINPTKSNSEKNVVLNK